MTSSRVENNDWKDGNCWDNPEILIGFAKPRLIRKKKHFVWGMEQQGSIPLFFECHTACIVCDGDYHGQAKAKSFILFFISDYD